jgi:hypothetical protein
VLVSVSHGVGVWLQIARQEAEGTSDEAAQRELDEAAAEEEAAAAAASSSGGGSVEEDPEPVMNSYGKEALGCRFGRDGMPTLCSTYPIARELSWVDFWHDNSTELDLVSAGFLKASE